MPNLEEHKKISEVRTGKSFEELHKWMDEATKSIGHNHRLERHFYTSDYEEFVRRMWGAKAVIEWLFHIAVDNLETANKFAIDAYNKSYDELAITFKDKEISSIDFIKTFAHSRKAQRYEKTHR